MYPATMIFFHSESTCNSTQEGQKKIPRGGSSFPGLEHDIEAGIPTGSSSLS
jgi:hypothetical protein